MNFLRPIALPALLLALFVSLSAPAQTNPLELPPSPFSLPSSTELQSFWYERDAARALELHAASTNAAVQNALKEIRETKEKLAVMETNTWQKDPMLLLCDRFIEKTHDWVMEKHHAELDAEADFFFSTNDTKTVESRRRLHSDLTRMMDMILLNELADNTNFAPIQRAVYDSVERIVQTATNASKPDVFQYWRFDRFIGYPGTNRPVANNSYTNLQPQIHKRYDLLVAGIAKIQQQQNIPAQAVAGIKYGHLYRTLDGLCETYLDINTPPELQKLREDLRRKIIDLSWLDK
jgi:hypothetical protein